MNSYRKVSEADNRPKNILNRILPDDFISSLKSLLGLNKRNNGVQPSFQSVFSSYRKVLENSNRAVGLVSEMNSRLGGDSPADMNHVKNIYSSLHLAVETAIKNFDIFTEYKYMELHEVFSRINRQINDIINGTASVDLPEPAHSPSPESARLSTNDNDPKILQHIAPLNLVDPIFDNFTPEGCKTIHDIIRFMHVKSVSHLARRGNSNHCSVPEQFSPAMR
ncbi:MAG: hypothetical protein C4581_08810 [Nitrospiraceae bacterium]|nr:MAG: hypothetical protein C4581_08810 [Nitrospiraceae bacterium]